MNIPIFGVIENMTFFATPDLPDKKYPLFGKGGGKQLSIENNVPLLAQLPMEMFVIEDGNEGWPIVDRHPDSLSGKAFKDLASTICQKIQK